MHNQFGSRQQRRNAERAAQKYRGGGRLPAFDPIKHLVSFELDRRLVDPTDLATRIRLDEEVAEIDRKLKRVLVPREPAATVVALELTLSLFLARISRDREVLGQSLDRLSPHLREACDLTLEAMREFAVFHALPSEADIPRLEGMVFPLRNEIHGAIDHHHCIAAYKALIAAAGRAIVASAGPHVQMVPQRLAAVVDGVRRDAPRLFDPGRIGGAA